MNFNLVSYLLKLQPGHKEKDAEYYRQFDYMSQCIGVGCWVLTTDKKVVFVENAAWKGEQACRVDRPGGHAEPGECAGEDATKLSGAEVRLVLCSAPSVPQPVVQSRRRPLLGPSPG